MTKTSIVVALTLALAPVSALAGSELAAAGADKAFFEAAFGRALPGAGLAQEWKIQKPAPIAQVSLPTMSWFSLSVLAQLGDAPQAAAATQVADIDLATLLNKQLKSSLKFSMGGKDVWVSGAFDRQQNAYVSILVDGQDAKFFNVKGLLDKEEQVSAGTNNYKLYLAPNVINQMKSEIILENAADEDDKVRVSLKKMLDAVGAAGAEAKVGDQAYKIFYTDDIKNGAVDKSAKTITFIHTEAGGQIHVFLIPAELVPSDKIAVFKMFKDRRVGLTQKDGKLKVFENP